MSMLERAIEAAIAAGIPPDDAALVAAEASLRAQVERARVQAEEEEAEALVRRQKILDSELAKQAAAALGLSRALANQALAGANAGERDAAGEEEEEEDGDNLDDERAQEESAPRKLARRKSRKYAFSDKVAAANTEELKKVFANHGGGAGFINAMQFSNVWRLITEEKGNLFKEMQVSR